MQRTHHYVVSAHRSTAVTHALTGSFTGSDHVNLILAKSTRLEVQRLSDDGLLAQLDVPLYGTIGSMCLFRPKVCIMEQCFCFVSDSSQRVSMRLAVVVSFSVHISNLFFVFNFSSMFNAFGRPFCFLVATTCNFWSIFDLHLHSLCASSVAHG